MITELLSCFDRTVEFLRDQVSDLSDEEIFRQPPGAPNHAAWTLGHMAYSCQAMACELGAEPWLGSEWESSFAYGTTPGALPVQLSRKDVLLEALEDAANRLRAVLCATDDTVLAAPPPDESARRFFPTTGHAVLQIMAAHTAYHAGQLAAWRRAVGRPATGVFI